MSFINYYKQGPQFSQLPNCVKIVPNLRQWCVFLSTTRFVRGGRNATYLFKFGDKKMELTIVFVDCTVCIIGQNIENSLADLHVGVLGLALFPLLISWIRMPATPDLNVKVVAGYLCSVSILILYGLFYLLTSNADSGE